MYKNHCKIRFNSPNAVSQTLRKNPARYALLVTTKSLCRAGISEDRTCRRGLAASTGKERKNALRSKYQVKITIHDARTSPDRNVRNIRSSSSMAAS